MKNLTRSTLAVKLLHSLGITAVVCGLALLCWHAGGLNRWEYKTWDWRARVLCRPGQATDQVRLIFLDQYSLDWASRENDLHWMWPREVFSAIVDYCRRCGAKGVIFDVLFTEPSHAGVEDDKALGAAIAATPGFVGALFLAHTNQSSTSWPAAIPRPKYAALHVASYREGFLHTLTCPQATFPIPEVAAQATVLGNVTSSPDSDGIYRRIRVFSRFDGSFVPCLGLAAHLAATTPSSLTLVPGMLQMDAYTIPLDRHGNAILRFRGPTQTHKAVNAAAVIQSEIKARAGEDPVIAPEFFRDRYVFFGYTAPGLFDLKPTAVASIFPGVEIHATFLDNLLSGDFIREVPWIGTVALLLLLTFGGVMGVRCAPHFWQAGLVFILALILPLVLGLVAYQYNLWLPVFVHWVALFPGLVLSLGLNYIMEGRQKRFIKGAFRQYLSPAVIEQLLQSPDRLTLGGELRELTIHFSDIKGFTSISEKLSAVQLTEFLNIYLTAMTDIILAEGGTVDKYVGDAVVAFWNAPIELPDHADRAVRAALRCQAKLAELRPFFERAIGTGIYARIGIHTGNVVVGNMGSNQRFDYTFLGDAGNLASRLEGINKKFGTFLVISEETRQRLGPRFCGRELSRIAVVGRTEPVRIFEPLQAATFQARQVQIEAFAKALNVYYEGHFKEAAALFAELADQDPPAAIYARRCEDLHAHPPAAWDGVWVMTEK